MHLREAPGGARRPTVNATVLDELVEEYLNAQVRSPGPRRRLRGGVFWAWLGMAQLTPRKRPTGHAPWGTPCARQRAM